MSLVVDEHREYLSDAIRLDAFRRALAERVRPGDVVVDVGSGTGVLGLLALQAGAARVHAIEAQGIIGIAGALARANGFGDRFITHQSFITETVLPERAAVAVGDFIGRFGFDAGIFDIYPRVRRHMLAPDGILIPSELSLFVAPVEHRLAAERVAFWAEPRSGLTLAPALEWARNTGYPVQLEPADLLGDPAPVATLPTGEPVDRRGIRAEIEARIARRGTLHGIGGWFSSRLSPGVEMTSSPLAASRIGRRNVFLPLGTPVEVDEGDRLLLRLGILPSDHIVTWKVEVVSRDGRSRGAQVHSTLRGMLATRDTLRKTRPDFVPSLTPRGQARLTVLQLCDGRRQLREVEDELFARHRAIFRSRDDAAAFVAEVVPVYSEG